MSQINRLSSGGRIDRNRPLTFSFNGQHYQGYAGDTLAAALLANGVDIVGRSFKYSRARGIVAAGAEEPNAILQIGSREATQIPTYAPPSRPSTAAWWPPVPTAGRTCRTT